MAQYINDTYTKPGKTIVNAPIFPNIDDHANTINATGTLYSKFLDWTDIESELLIPGTSERVIDGLNTSKNIIRVLELLVGGYTPTPSNTYTITLNVNHGTKNPTGTQTAQSGGSVSWQVTPDTNYHMPNSISGATISGPTSSNVYTVTISNVTATRIYNCECKPDIDRIVWVNTSASSEQGSSPSYPQIRIYYKDGNSTTYSVPGTNVSLSPTINANTNAGTYNITATYTDPDTGHTFTTTNTLTYTVTPHIPDDIEVTSISPVSGYRGTLYNDNANVDGAYTTQLSVEFTPSNATNKSLTWTSSHPNYLTVDANGKVTVIGAPTSNSGVDVTVTATSNNGKTCTFTINVKGKYYLRCNINPSSGASINPTFSQYVTPGSSMTWTITPNDGYQMPTSVNGATISGNTVTISNIHTDKTITVNLVEINKTYYWYVGAEQPTALPTSDSELATGIDSGWRKIGTTKPSAGTVIFDGTTQDEIVCGTSKVTQYFAINSDVTIGAYDSFGTDQTSSTFTGPVVSNGMNIYTTVSKSKTFGEIIKVK